MLAASDTPIENAIRTFAEYGMAAAYIVPTKIGLTKSIIDAHESVRAYFKSTGIHDFAAQQQGQDYKKLVEVTVVESGSSTSPSVMSLYRPDTKKGDPRLWIKGLGKYATAGNLIALVADHEGSLYVVNCSNAALFQSIVDPSSPLGRLVRSKPTNVVADELRAKLEAIQRQGFIQSLRTGPTGVGFTLESLLGIAANTKRTPDYKGIELKSGRRKSKSGKSSQLTTLFSKTPEWTRSALGVKETLATFGYRREGRLQLYCTVGPKANTLGLHTCLTNNSMDFEVHGTAVNGTHSGPVNLWDSATLESRLMDKHRETFWVDALVTRDTSGSEWFHYIRATHTQQPLVGNLGTLLELGKVTVDYTLSERSNGSVRDHGYLFRMMPTDRDLLFPKPALYQL